MAACDPCPAPINVTVKMSSSPAPKCCSRRSSKASCRGGGDPACNNQQQAMPNYMKPLSRTPSYSARISVGNAGRNNMCCANHPRPDCCKVPCPLPCAPRCPLGIYVERTESMKPCRTFEPSDAKFEGLSTYREHYFLKCGEKAQSYKPTTQFVPSEAPLDGISTYRETFYCKPVQPRQTPPWKGNSTFDPSCAKMDGISQYRFDYKGCMSPPPASFKPMTTFVPSDAKLEGATTYRLNYIPYCPREYDYARPKQIVKQKFSPSCAPMEGASTYRMDYYPKCFVRTNNLKPSTKPRFSDAKMAGITTYKNDFIPFHFDKCCPQQCIPAEIYDERYPNPCLFSCSGDTEIKMAEPDDPCPNMASAPNPCGIDPCQPYPYTAGNAGQQIQDCCECLHDPPPKQEEEDC